jgi:hypothetical protein
VFLHKFGSELEDEKGIEEVVKIHLKEKEETCEKFESEVVSFKEELNKSNPHFKFEKSTKTLNDILSFQRSPFINTGLGYDKKQKTHEGHASTKLTKISEKENEEKSNRYDNILK